MDGGVSADFQSLNVIEISWLVQVLFNFDWFWGSSMGVADGRMEVGWVWIWGVSNACTHAHACTHMHMHVKHDKHGCLHVGSHLQFLYMYTCACMHACACVCMHVCACMWGYPHASRCSQTPPPTCLLRRATGSPKHQNSISLEVTKIILFFCDSVWRFFTSELSWTHIDYSCSPQIPPTPQSWGNPNRKNYNNSWKNQDNSILFKDLGPLNPPAHI